MKRAAAMILILCLEVSRAFAGNGGCPKITFGAEWGYIGTIYSGYHYNFFAPEGYRVDPREHSFKYDTNAEASFHIGYNFNPQKNLSLHLGVSAVEDYHHIIPISLRFTWFYGKKSYIEDRWFSFVDIGSGVCIKKRPQEILTGKIGGGYRMSLSRNVKIDLVLALRTALTHPEIEYYGTVIEYDKINRNNAYISAISLGMALTF